MMNEIDYGILITLGLSAIISFWRGFLKEIISLISWIAAFFIAFTFINDAAAHLEPYIGYLSGRIVIAFGGLFLATLFIGGLVNILVAQLVRATGLSAIDRTLGIVFGLARGGSLIALLVLLGGLTPLPESSWWQGSVLLPHFQQAALWLRGFLPSDLASYFKFP